MRCSARLASPTVLHVVVDDQLLVFQFNLSTLAACCVSLGGQSNEQPVVVVALGDRRVVAELVLPRRPPSPPPPVAANSAHRNNVIAGDQLLTTLGSWPAALGAATDVVCASVHEGVCVLCAHGWTRVVAQGSSPSFSSAAAAADSAVVGDGERSEEDIILRKWRSPAAAIRSAALLPAGPLRDALQVPGLPPAPVALVAGDVSGRVVCVPGASADAAIRAAATAVTGSPASPRPSALPRRPLPHSACFHAELVQETCLCAVNGHHGSIAVIIGALGACVAIWPSTEGQRNIVSATRFDLPTDGFTLRRDRLLISWGATEHDLCISSLGLGFQVVIHLEDCSSATHVQQNRLGRIINETAASNASNPTVTLVIKTYRRRARCAPALPMQAADEDHGKALRALLDGINVAGELRKSAVQRSALLERVAASINAATFCALAWRPSSSETNSPFTVACRLRGFSATPNSATAVRLAASAPWAGTEAVIVAELAVGENISLGDGWVLQLQWCSVRDGYAISENVDYQLDTQNSVHAAPGIRVPNSSSMPRRVVSQRILRTMSRPIGVATREGSHEVQFPVLVNSHAPISVSVVLLFVLQSSVGVPNTETSGRNAGEAALEMEDCLPGVQLPPEEMLRIPLLKEHVLDVLDFSRCVDVVGTTVNASRDSDENVSVAHSAVLARSLHQSATPSLQTGVSRDRISSEASHRLLPSARLANFFDPRNTQGRMQPKRFSIQFELPLGKSDVAVILMDSPEEEQAPDVASIRRETVLGAQVEFELSQGSSDQRTVINVRAASHVAPFVRAAVLRRLWRKIKALRTKQTEVIGCAAGSRERERTLLDAANATHKDLRQVQDKLSELDRWIDEILHKANLDSCMNEQDSDCVRDALGSLTTAYLAWRQACKQCHV